jgi:hypothetical protein
MCAFRNYLKHKNTIKHYRSAIRKMKKFNLALVIGVAYKNPHKCNFKVK